MFLNSSNQIVSYVNNFKPDFEYTNYLVSMLPVYVLNDVDYRYFGKYPPYTARKHILSILKQSFDPHWFDEMIHSYELSTGLDASVARERFKKLSDIGYWPVSLRSVPDKGYYRQLTPLICVESTDPEFAWVPYIVANLCTDIQSTLEKSYIRRSLEKLAGIYGHILCESSVYKKIKDSIFYYSDDDFVYDNRNTHNLKSEIYNYDVIAASHRERRIEKGVLEVLNKENEVTIEIHQSKLHSLLEIILKYKDILLKRTNNINIRVQCNDPVKLFFGTSRTGVFVIGQTVENTLAQQGLLPFLEDEIGVTMNTRGCKQFNAPLVLEVSSPTNFTKLANLFKMLTYNRGVWSLSNFRFDVSFLYKQYTHTFEVKAYLAQYTRKGKLRNTSQIIYDDTGRKIDLPIGKIVVGRRKIGTGVIDRLLTWPDTHLNLLQIIYKNGKELC